MFSFLFSSKYQGKQDKKEAGGITPPDKKGFLFLKNRFANSSYLLMTYERREARHVKPIQWNHAFHSKEQT